ncbi:ribonuclease hi [Plakobranchus ocellatus]|uniref:Ribonuclease hi n=1 Tax=Plakobranchus ocellatus TaxID=259542 RepID=A0AAV4A7K6_9GAST|nr:ribonuclease hi [Plakobranchus ocellatus]
MQYFAKLSDFCQGWIFSFSSGTVEEGGVVTHLVGRLATKFFSEGANKLHEVLPNLGEDLHRRGEGAGRKLETAMCRLRVGHTWLTQSYLLKNDQPFCYACDSLYTVRHILSA